MSFSVGIVGLPNVGKSTLFKTLTKIPADIAPYPFTTIQPNVGVVIVPDQRLKKIAEVIKPEKITPTIIEFFDIAGLVKGSHKGEGLGNQFLAQIRNCNAILEVVRGFSDPKIENVLGEINPKKEIEVIKTELLMKDLETLEGLIQKIERDVKRDKKSFKKFELFKKLKERVAQGELISEIDLTEEEKKEINEYQFLTVKPIFYLFNTDGGQPPATQTKCLNFHFKQLAMNLKEEEEISELSEVEVKELMLKSQLDQLILACYNVLDLITFYTVAGEKETRARTLKRGQIASEAAGQVHSDFEKKFIRAEVITWSKLIEVGSWKEAKEKGLIQIVGRDYLVKDGDVIEFKI